MKINLAILCCLSFLVLNAQKTEVYNESGFRHDYAIGDLAYLEDLRDTLRLKYIATLRVSGAHQGILMVAAFQDLVKIKAKEMGANVYYATGYSEDESNASLEVKLYFGGEKFLKQNITKRDTNTIYVFNQVRLPNDTVTFFVATLRKTFESKKFCRMQAEPGREYLINTDKGLGASENVVFKKTKPSRFFIMPSRRNAQMNLMSTNRGVPGIIEAGVLLSNFYELKYSTGRLLIAVYR